MDKDLLNTIFSVIGIIVLLYVIYKMYYYNFSNREGLTSGTPTTTAGIAGNAIAYAADIKSSTIKLQDTLLISKYRTDYETAILNLDDYVNILMLQTALSIDTTNPNATLLELTRLQQAKNALNDTMLFIDKQ